MQVVINKCFSLKKFGEDPLVVFDKNERNVPLIPINDVTVPKARLL